jgi:hypothetical protein
MTKELHVSVSLDGHFEVSGEATFSVSLAGVTHANANGTSRQDLLAECRAGEVVELRREPDNPHDRCAVAVHRLDGTQLGYVPAGDRRLASHLDRGGKVSARITKIHGGPTVVDRLFWRKGRSYGGVIQIEKGDFDWHRVSPFMNMDREASRLVREARCREKDAPTEALALYQSAWAQIAELDACGILAQAWRTTRYPINRMSLILERTGEHRRAFELVESYLADRDPIGLTKEDDEAVRKRRERLAPKLGQD